MDLKEARFKARLAQWDLRSRTGISQTKISLLERGYVAAKPEGKKALARALGFRPEQIDWPNPVMITGGPDACETR
jgi:predicted transcriptional regulator